MDSFFTSFLEELSVCPRDIQIVSDSAKIHQGVTERVQEGSTTLKNNNDATQKFRDDLIDTINKGLLLVEEDLDLFIAAPRVYRKEAKARRFASAIRKTRNANVRSCNFKTGKLAQSQDPTTLLSVIVSCGDLPSLAPYPSMMLDQVQ